MRNSGMYKSLFSLSRLVRIAPVLATLAAPLMLGSAARAGELMYDCPDLDQKASMSTQKSAMYQGTDGWFFRQDDVDHSSMLSDQSLRFLDRLNALLKNKGVSLLLMPMPSRAMIESKFLPPDGIFGDVIYDVEFARAEFNDLLSKLKMMGIRTVDLATYLDGKTIPNGRTFYFARDIHWFPEGAQVAAGAVLDVLKDDEKYQSLEKKDYVSKVVQKDFIFASNTTLLLNEICKSKIPKERFDLYQTSEANQSLDAFLASDNTAQNQLHLLGTSYSDEANRYNFAGFLRDTLHLDVVSYALTGGGDDQSLFWWTHDRTTQSNLPPYLLWELPFFTRLNLNVDYMERQILPGVQGSCKGGPDYVAGTEYSATNHVDLPVPTGNATGSRYYIAGTMSDASIRDVTVKVDYSDIKSESTALTMPNRVRNIDTFYLELSDEFTGNVKSVSVDFGSQNPVSGDLMICKYPDAVASSAKF